jgi:hypothetical protein
VQTPLARLPGAHLHAERRHQDALIARALEVVKVGPTGMPANISSLRSDMTFVKAESGAPASSEIASQTIANVAPVA